MTDDILELLRTNGHVPSNSSQSRMCQPRERNRKSLDAIASCELEEMTTGVKPLTPVWSQKGFF